MVAWCIWCKRCVELKNEESHSSWLVLIGPLEKTQSCYLLKKESSKAPVRKTKFWGRKLQLNALFTNKQLCPNNIDIWQFNFKQPPIIISILQRLKIINLTKVIFCIIFLSRSVWLLLWKYKYDFWNKQMLRCNYNASF